MYYLIYGFFKLLSFLPFRVLFLLADFIYVLLFYVFGYRKEVAVSNLLQAFPEKTEAERKQILKKFYHNFADTFVESIKLLSISFADLNKRITCDYSLIDKIKAEGKSCQVHCGHSFNWEWGNLHFGNHCALPMLGVYAPLENPTMNRLFLKFRSRGQTVLLSSKEMGNEMLKWRKQQYALVLVADQSASKVDNCYWANFFGKLTSIASGPEKGAVRGNLPVLYFEFLKPKRGHYDFRVHMLEENPASLKDGELTVKYIRRLEESIRKQPEIYLWSHKRYKRPFNEAFRHLVVE
jgi:Kdo2-lipid IVA lauroyltransferase/acyltransferase